jgi:hypothetical protein
MHSLYYPDGQVAVGDPSRVREWLHEIRKTDRLTAALIGQAIQHA